MTDSFERTSPTLTENDLCVTGESKTICGVQTNVRFADPAANLARLIQWLDAPELASADLVVFPECMISGYCFASRADALLSAQSIEGVAVQTVSQWCKAHGKYVAFGMLETDSRGHLFNSCPLVGPNGLVGCYRKVHLPYLGVDRFTDAGTEGFRVWEIDGLKVGAHICYDASFPESSRCLALQGADLLLLPTNWPPGADTFARYLPNARALENNVYFMSVNRVGTEKGFRFIGNSRICDPNGNPIADAPHENECILKAKIDVAWARNKRIVRVPKEHVIDRWADRRPLHYSTILEQHGLGRYVESAATTTSNH